MFASQGVNLVHGFSSLRYAIVVVLKPEGGLNPQTSFIIAVVAVLASPSAPGIAAQDVCQTGVDRVAVFLHEIDGGTCSGEAIMVPARRVGNGARPYIFVQLDAAAVEESD